MKRWMMKRDQENEMFLKLIVTDGRVRGWHPAVPLYTLFPPGPVTFATPIPRRKHTDRNMPKRLSDFHSFLTAYHHKAD
jgi:hypothetical protein